MSNKVVSFKFQPFSRQQKKLLTWWMPGSPYANYSTMIASGAIRSGKTIACIDAFFTWSLSQFSGQNFILAGKSMGALKRNVIQPGLQILTAKGIDYKYLRSGPDARIVIGNNNYYLFGANNEASQDILVGLTSAGCYGDEVALFPQSFVNQMIGRCSVPGSKHWFNCNPQGPYNYIKTDYIDQAVVKKILSLHFTLDDNLTLSDEIKNLYKRMFTGVFYQRNINGLWVMAEGIVYPGFNEADHCIGENEVPEDFDAVYYVVDHGLVNTFAAIRAGLKYISGKPHFFITDELYDNSEGRTDPIVLQKYQRYVRDDRATHIPDPAAAAFVTMLKKLYKVKPAIKSVQKGISTVSHFLDENRIHIVKKKCPNLLKEFASYRWDEKKIVDEPVKEFDHLMDCVRYLCFTLFPLSYTKPIAPDGEKAPSRWNIA